jgi:hypothetical protein
MILLCKEDPMTHQRALSSIESHYKCENKLTFKQKQEQLILAEFLKQLPNRVKKMKDEEDISKLYYDDNKKFDA